MRTTRRIFCAASLTVASLAMGASLAFAQGANWDVAKSSGDVQISHANAQPVSLTSSMQVTPGDTIRTGGSGRLLLKRGEESMLVSPNSVIEIPSSNHDGMSTTIMERAGSVLLEVEKRKVQHFEVVTPYLAAVVKGTHFRVSMDDTGSHVDVLRGQVDVVDYKSGDEALVLPGQTAQVAATGSSGLTLSGSGSFNPIIKGSPRPSPVAPASPTTRSASAQGQESQPSSGEVALASNDQWQLKPKSEADLKRLFAKDTSDQEFLSNLTIPVSIGILITLGVAVQRTRRKFKKSRKDKK